MMKTEPPGIKQEVPFRGGQSVFMGLNYSGTESIWNPAQPLGRYSLFKRFSNSVITILGTSLS